MDDSRPIHLQAVRHRVAAGAYVVDPDAVAAAMLARLLSAPSRASGPRPGARRAIAARQDPARPSRSS